MKNKIFILPILLLLTANRGLCATASAVNAVAVKFLLAMAGVVVSSLFIYFGLALYNKYFVKPQTEEDFTNSPKTVDDAVKFFINRNKLK